MTDKERKWIWENIDKLTKAEFELFCKYNDDIALAEIALHQLYLSVKNRVVGEVTK